MNPVVASGRDDALRPPLEEEVVHRVSWLIRLRWFAAGATIALTWLSVGFLGLELPVGGLTGLGTAIAVYNLGFLWVVRWELQRPSPSVEVFKRLASAQFLVDWVALSFLMHLTGGIDSPVVFYFLFHAIIGSILLPPRAIYIHATIGVALVGTMAMLEMKGVLLHIAIPGFLAPEYDRPLHVLGLFFFFATAIYVSVYLASAITSRLQRRTRELAGLKRDLEEALHRTRTLYNIAQAVSSSLNQKEVLDTIAWLAARSMNVKACSIRLLDEGRGLLQVAAAWGLSDAYLAKGPVDPDKAVVDREVLKGHPVSIEDVALEPGLFQYPEEALREGIRSVLCVPLSVRERRIGVLRVYTGVPHRFSQEETDFLVTLASQGAVAIENARAYRNLEELDRAKSRFVFAVAHELKAPVAAVLSRLATLDEGYAGDLSEKQRDLVIRAIRRMTALQALIRDLLALGALQGRLPERIETDVDVQRVLRRLVELIQPEADGKGVVLRVRVPEDPVFARATEEDVERLAGNLLENAVKYTRPGGSVDVDLAQDGGGVRLTVRDTGIGIPPQSLPHIFDEFFRARNAKDLGEEGTGLGLSLVKRIVDLYQGEVRVDSTLDQGTTFVVTLPVKRAPDHPGLDVSAGGAPGISK